MLEIVGFWTPEYLRHKLDTLRKANMGRFILCIDAARNCAQEELPRQANVIRYKRHVPATEVLKILEQP
jgi:predicted nuclease of restriction endonuclease-like RecB superfamily